MIKIKRLLLSMAILTASVLTVIAQNEIYTLQLEELPYTYVEPKKSAGDVILDVLTVASGGSTDNNHQGFRSHVNNDVKTAISRVRRLMVVDEYSDIPVFRVTGEIPLINTTTKEYTHIEKDKNGKEHKRKSYAHGANITVNLTITDLETGEMVTETFKASEFPSQYYTEEEALTKASSSVGFQVEDYFNRKFPLTGNIIERGEAKKDKEKEVYVDLGDQNRVSRGVSFDVYKIGQVAGRQTRSKLGQIKIEEVLGDDISLCKVNKGKKEIKAALDAGQTLIAVSTN